MDIFTESAALIHRIKSILSLSMSFKYLPEKKGCRVVQPMLVQKYCRLDSQHRPAVVEKAKNIDGMKPFTEWQEKNGPVRDIFGFPIDGT
jgi:hypothetical protein